MEGRWLVKEYVYDTKPKSRSVQEGMLAVKKDARYAKFSLNGMDYGAHAVDTDWEQSQETWNIRQS